LLQGHCHVLLKYECNMIGMHGSTAEKTHPHTHAQSLIMQLYAYTHAVQEQGGGEITFQKRICMMKHDRRMQSTTCI